jgi:hypothetical protein
MKPAVVIHRIFCALAMLAVLLGPVGVTTVEAAMASSASMSGMTMEMPGPAVDEQMADMPCCPEEKKPVTPDCTKSCPLALVCSSIVVGNLSAGNDLLIVYAVPLSFALLQDAVCSVSAGFEPVFH